MKWNANTLNMVKKASKRLWILRRLKQLGASTHDLVDVYIKQVRCVLELAAPAWQGGISQAEKLDLERVQKCAAHIILGNVYSSYSNALEILNLESLEVRRNNLFLKFAVKSEKHQKFKAWFKPTKKTLNTRAQLSRYCEVRASSVRFAKSPISFLTNLLNLHYRHPV